MHTLELLSGPGKTTTFTFPGGWNEVSAEQLPKLALLLALLGDEVDTRTVLLQTLSGIPASAFAEPNGIPVEDLCVTVEATADEPMKVVFLPQLDWCFTPPDFSPETPSPAKSLLPEVVLGGVVYAGPGDGLDLFTFNRFVWTDSLFQSFAAAATEENLHNFLGAAYQPNYASWRNEPIEEYGRKLKGLPHATKLAAVLNYRGLRAAMAKLYPSVFANDPTAPAGTSQGLFGMVYDVADGGVFGAVPEVRNTLMHDVLGYVQHSTEKTQAATPVAPPTREPEYA